QILQIRHVISFPGFLPHQRINIVISVAYHPYHCLHCNRERTICQFFGVQMENIERKNSAVIKAEFSTVIENVRISKQPMIIQKHDKDVAAIVPLEMLQQSKRREK